MWSKPGYGTALFGTFVPLAQWHRARHTFRTGARAENNRHCIQPALSHPQTDIQRPSRELKHFQPESDTHPRFFIHPNSTQRNRKTISHYIYIQVLAKICDTYFWGLKKVLVRLWKITADRKTFSFTQDLTIPLYWVTYYNLHLSIKRKLQEQRNCHFCGVFKPGEH